MSNQTDKLKIREVKKSWIEQQRIEYFERYKLLSGEDFEHSTSIHTDLGVPPEFHGPDESLSTRFIRDTHISFARFYHEHSGSEPPLSDEQIYELWQEKSREK